MVPGCDQSLRKVICDEKCSRIRGKNRFSELIALAESGEEIAITRRGTAVARIVSARALQIPQQRAEVVDIFNQLRALRGTIELYGDLKSLAREGLD